MNTTVKGAIEGLKNGKVVKNGFQTVTKIEFDGRRLYTVTHADGSTRQVENNVPFFTVLSKTA